VLFLSYKFLSSWKKQSLIIVLVISGAVAIYLFSYSMLNGMIKATLDKSLGLAIPHVEITCLENESYIKDVNKLYSLLYESREVSSFSPRLIHHVIVRLGSRSIGVELRGVDIRREDSVSGILQYIVSGNNTLESSAILIGERLADKLGVESGDRVFIVFPNGKVLKVKVIGIFDTGILQFDESVVYADLRYVSEAMNETGKVNNIIVKVTDPRVAEKVSSFLRDEGYNARCWKEIAENLVKLLKTEEEFTGILMETILVMTSLGIMNVIILLTESKKRVIGILKSIGAMSSEILLVYLFIAVVYGFIGFIIGGIIARIIADIVGSITIELMTTSLRVSFIWDVKTILLSLGFSILASTISCAFSAYKASTLKPVEVMRFG